MADLSEEKKKIRANMGRTATPAVLPPPVGSIRIERPERNLNIPAPATAGEFAGRAARGSLDFVNRGASQINQAMAAPFVKAASEVRDLSSGFLRGAGLSAPVVSPSFAASPPSEDQRLSASGMSPQEIANFRRYGSNPDQSWDNGGAALPGSTLRRTDGNAQFDFTIPEGRSTGATSLQPSGSATLDLRSEALKTLGANPDRRSLRSQALTAPADQPEFINIAGRSYVPVGDGPMVEGGVRDLGGGNFEFGTGNRSIDLRTGKPGEVQTWRGTKDWRYEGESNGVPVFRNLQSGATFATQAEAQSGNPVTVTQGAASAAKDAAEATTLPGFRGAQSNYYNANAEESRGRGLQARSEAEVNRAIAEGRIRGKAGDSNKREGVPSGVAELFTSPDTGALDEAALAEFSQFSALTGNRDALDAYGEYSAAKKAGVPLQALQYLLQNPDKRNEFKAKYGWLPK